VAITASGGFARQLEVTVERGTTIPFAGYRLTYVGERVCISPSGTCSVAGPCCSKGRPRPGPPHPVAEPLSVLHRAHRHPVHRLRAVRDLYSTVIGFEDGGARATFRLFLNPGVLWLWVGGFVVAIGGLIAAWPPPRRRVVVRPEAPPAAVDVAVSSGSA
jgi:cytochrome c-type biogenesis protein CcmF